MSISQIGTREDDNIVFFNIMPRGLGVATPTLNTFGAALQQRHQQKLDEDKKAGKVIDEDDQNKRRLF
jgi:hypothetical protein